MRTRSFLLAGAAAVVLAAASVTGIALATSPGHPQTSLACSPPALPGQQVTVVLGDMGAMMNGGMMPGSMMLHVAPQSLPAGTVSMVALNHGTITHELVVLPLAPGASVGTRAVGADTRSARTPASARRRPIAAPVPGRASPQATRAGVTIALKPGRYELLCNLPGHYAAGMYGELDVT
jgi:uncharacterized cupredoxin-like copper-binding protein